MRYAEFAPSPRFAALVECFWLLEGLATGAADAIIPDGRIELIVHYSGTFWRHQPEDGPTRQPSALLVGQMVEPVVLAPEGRSGVAAIRLRPAAARALLGFSLDEVAGRFVDLETIFPTVRGVRDRLAEASTDAARIRALEQWLGEIFRTPPTSPITAVVAAILESGGRASMSGLSSSSGIGLRQLERQFRDDVGLSPKTFARIVRLQSALRGVRSGRALSDVALACGYYDQAHMTRDFRQLAAMSPGAWQAHAGDLAPLFIGGT